MFDELREMYQSTFNSELTLSDEELQNVILDDNALGPVYLTLTGVEREQFVLQNMARILALLGAPAASVSMFDWLRGTYKAITGRELLITDAMIDHELEATMRFGAHYGLKKTNAAREAYIKDNANAIISYLQNCTRVLESQKIMGIISRRYEQVYGGPLEVPYVDAYAYVRHEYVSYCRISELMEDFSTYVDSNMNRLLVEIRSVAIRRC